MRQKKRSKKPHPFWVYMVGVNTIMYKVDGLKDVFVNVENVKNLGEARDVLDKFVRKIKAW